MADGFLLLETEPFTTERVWTVEDIPVLTARVSLPRPLDRTGRTPRRIDRFYQLQGRSYLRYCDKWLFPRAAAEFYRAAAGSASLPAYTAEITHRVTCSEGGIWSLYTQMRECAQGRTEIARRGDTWDLRTGYPVPLEACFPRHNPVRRRLLAAAEEELRRQESAGLRTLPSGWRLALRRNFNRENFYLTPSALCFFWQPYTIAGSADVSVFTLPFSEGSCRWPGIAAAPSGERAVP